MSRASRRATAVRWLLAIAGALLSVLVLAWTVGSFLPVAHVAAVRTVVHAPPEVVFDAIADVRAAPAWRSGLQRVDVLSAPGEPVRWREVGGSGALVLAQQELRRPSHIVTRIDDPGQPFGGRWIYSLAPAPAGTTVTITEEGEVYNPVFRFVSRFVFGHHAGLEQYARDLQRHLGKDSGR